MIAKKKRIIIKRDPSSKSIFAIASFLYVFFVAGAVTDNLIIGLISNFILFALILFFDLRKAILLLVVMTPNSMLVSLPSLGVRIIGIAYALVFLRLILHYDLSPNAKIVIISSIVLLICALKIMSGGIHDLITCLQTILVICFWMVLLKNRDKVFESNIYKSFIFGTILMSVGMVINRLISGENRMMALLDDSNYTGVVFSVLFASSLLLMFFNIHRKYNLLVFIYALLMGLSTGSRAFLLSIGMAVLFYFLLSLRYKKVRIIVFALVALFAVFIILYLVKVPVVVKVYDMTIGRTFELLGNYNDGNFMDVTSGRMFLWEYYLTQLFGSAKTSLFGIGFSQYYLVENGGYGLVAHNTFVSGLMGFGIIGTLLILILYCKILSFGQNFRKHKLIYLSSLTILIALLVGYFFLDGLLDVRLSLYLSVYVIVQRICLDKHCKKIIKIVHRIKVIYPKNNSNANAIA